MFFTSTRRYDVSTPQETFKNRVVGNHVKIHDLDFEVLERDQSLKIIPHAEQTKAIKTLPITDVRFQPNGKVIVTSKMRRLDAGGPQLLMIFCAFLIAASVVLLFVGREKVITYTMLSLGAAIFAIFMIRMQIGYFDYVRKVQAFVKNNLA